jgi:hypothetical protein
MIGVHEAETHRKCHVQSSRIRQPIQMPPFLTHRIAYRVNIQLRRIARCKRDDGNLWVTKDIEVSGEAELDLGGKVARGGDDGAA